MFRKFITLLLFAGMAQADTFEEMYKNSYVAYCNQGICNDAETGEFVKALNIDMEYVGYVILFNKEYSPVEIDQATRYIVERYREDGSIFFN